MKTLKVMLLCTVVFCVVASSAEVKLSPNSYPEWFQSAIQPLLMMDKENAVVPFIKALEGKKSKSSKKQKESTKKEEVKDANLLRVEGGRVASIVDNVDLSMELLTPCLERFRAQETEAVVSVSKTARKAGSTIAGEGINLYEEKPFEKVMVYSQQALNYLVKNNLEGAMVELRNADAEQKRAAEKYAKEMEKVKSEGKDVNYDEVIQKNYAGLDELVGQVKSSFQNAYSFYLYGVISECSGVREGRPSDINDAYIAYKDALEICPENVYIQRDLIRLAKVLNMADDYKELIQRFPQHASAFENYQPNNDSGHLVVIFEDGLVPRLHEISISIPGPDGELTMSFPTYSAEDKREPRAMEVRIDSNSMSGNTEVLCNTAGLAAKSLKERLPGMIVREVIQTLALGVAQHQAKKKLGALGSIGVSALDKAISKADLRGIYSLPYYIQCFRTEVSPGKHTVTLSPSGAGEVNLEVDVKPKSFTIIRVTCIENAVYHKVIQL